MNQEENVNEIQNDEEESIEEEMNELDTESNQIIENKDEESRINKDQEEENVKYMQNDEEESIEEEINELDVDSNQIIENKTEGDQIIPYQEENTSMNLEETLEAQGLFDDDVPLEDRDLSEEELKEFRRNLIEGALYAAGSALTIEELSTKLDISKVETEELLKKLISVYDNRSTALTIAKTGEKFQMQIKSIYSDQISKFAQGGAIAEKYLRTLTIIALKQPILKSTVVKIRGSGAYEHVKYLEENQFITSIKKGRTSELTTTDLYSEMFGLPKDIQEMKKVMIEQLGINEE
ncbi:MAG: SMC-Scp complex subunit ScpB [Candidatus Lokiarchaeota archaeon]